MSEDKENKEKKSKFGEKLKKDKKFRFEFIIGIWSGVVSIVLVVAVAFVAKAYVAGNNNTIDSSETEIVADNTPVIVSDPAVTAKETAAPYESALISDNEEDFFDEEDEEAEELKTAKTAYATTVVNLRQEPALTAAVIDKLQPGDMVTIIEYDKEWTKVNYDGKVGYVSTIYLNVRKPAKEPETSAAPVKETAAPTEAPPTVKPTKTPKPEKTLKPEKTPKPQQTKPPVVTDIPEPTVAPEPTKAPEPIPEPTKAPPEPTVDPEPTKAPPVEETKAPEATPEAIG